MSDRTSRRAEVSGNAVLWLNDVLSRQISVCVSGCVAVGVYRLSDSLVSTGVVGAMIYNFPGISYTSYALLGK